MSGFVELRPRMLEIIENPNYDFGEEAVVFSRYSPSELTASRTVKQQTLRCNAFAKRMALRIVRVFFSESDAAGLDDCPAWDEMLKFCDEHHVQNMIVDTPAIISIAKEDEGSSYTGLLMSVGCRVHFASDRRISEEIHIRSVEGMKLLVANLDEIHADLNNEPGTTGYWRRLKASFSTGEVRDSHD
jgi:hypothetical protein